MEKKKKLSGEIISLPVRASRSSSYVVSVSVDSELANALHGTSASSL